jgi:hypothetical protein
MKLTNIDYIIKLKKYDKSISITYKLKNLFTLNLYSILKNMGLKKKITKKKNFDYIFFKFMQYTLININNFNMIIFKSYFYNLSRLNTTIMYLLSLNNFNNFILLNVMSNYNLKTKRKRRLKRKVTKRLNKSI